MISFRPIAKVAAISFDLDDTLYDNHPYMLVAERHLLSYIHQQFPLAADKDSTFWRRCKAEVLAKAPEFASDMGLLRFNTLQTGFEKSGYKGRCLIQAVQQCFDHFYFLRSDFQVDETVCSLLSKLANRVPLVAITNGNVNLTQIGIAQYFQFSLHANLAQPMKPDPCMFDIAQQKIGINAKHILHVGDNLEKDVMGARQAGYASARFACNRPMNLSDECPTVLPDIQLDHLDELLSLVL
jgi:HAD superfamily hydrolase (TIGR01549 family)